MSVAKDRGGLTDLLRGPRDWRRRSTKLYPLGANAAATRPDANGRFGWEFVYFPAIARGTPAAVLLGCALPVLSAGASLALPLTDDLLPAGVILLLTLATGFGMSLGVSLACAYVVGRPYWQPGVVSLLLLAMAAGIPFGLVAQAWDQSGPQPQAIEYVLRWLTVQGPLMAVACCVAGVLWLPVAWWLYRRRGVSRVTL
ncbi:hypothetical protein [Nonomuraea sp. KM88]|uniref:hypothetical protein n=1 Tax=Nonomuraea sp. KM88 TaxID=3457427 RepID=UPI003FCD7D6C